MHLLWAACGVSDQAAKLVSKCAGFEAMLCTAVIDPHNPRAQAKNLKNGLSCALFCTG